GEAGALQCCGVHLTVDLGGGYDAGQTVPRNAELGQHVVVPFARRDVHQLRAARIRDVDDVHSTLWAAREVPGQPAVDGAEQCLARLRLPARTFDVVQDPAQLRTRKISRQRQSGPLAEAVLSAITDIASHQLRRARVHPYQRVAQGSTRCLVPQHRGFALIGYADGGQIGGI